MGINYRGHDLHTIIKKAQKAPGGEQPLPEAVLWLLLSGEFPTK
jgi:citrate synthase